MGVNFRKQMQCNIPALVITESPGYFLIFMGTIGKSWEKIAVWRVLPDRNWRDATLMHMAGRSLVNKFFYPWFPADVCHWRNSA